jgi:hypothetical protein
MRQTLLDLHGSGASPLEQLQAIHARLQRTVTLALVAGASAIAIALAALAAALLR